MMPYLRHIARLIMGAVFVFSGFVKVIDPLGFTYKITDYFEAWGVSGLDRVALVLAVLVCSGELLIGLSLSLRIRMRTAAWALMTFMSFFTALTLLVALTNPVTDCGCFGDAIILTNWQTFFKNIIFLVPTVLVFVERNRYDRPFTAKADWIIVATLFMGSVMLSLYCFRNLPLIDFRPYHRGANIEEGMAIPEGMPVDRYETVMIYKKNGVEAEYTLKSPEQPWADTTYTWVATNNILVEKGYEPPIHDFTLVDSTGEDVTAQVLADPGYSLLVVNYDLTRASRDGMERVSRFAAQAQQNGLKVYGMTSSLHEVVEQVQTQFDLTYAYYTTDEITLKTMVRSNPGVILLKQGTVLDKWHYRNLPDSAYFETQLNANALSQLEKARNRNLSFTWVMILLFIGFVVLYFRPGRGLLAG